MFFQHTMQVCNSLQLLSGHRRPGTRVVIMANWEGSTRRETLPANWQRLRRVVFRRAGYQCQHVRVDTGMRCKTRANQCDHVGDRDDHSLSNLRALCEYHHQIRSSSQGGQAHAARFKRAEKQHPGVA